MEIKIDKILGGKSAKIAKILVQKDQTISENQIVAYLETKKGNMPVKSTTNFKVKDIHKSEGDEVFIGDIIISSYEEKVTSSINNNIKSKIDSHCDLLVIGAGPGGYVAAIYAAQRGLNVILVEKEYLGGTCLNVGCIPTKALVKSSELLSQVYKSNLFGININSPQVDMNQVVEHKNKIVRQLSSGIEYLLEQNKIKLIIGEGYFVNESEVTVKGDINYNISFKNVIIATGSKISKISIPGIENKFVLNSTTALELCEIPKSLTIIGGGVIGMEFAFIYQNFGVEVNVIEYMPNILSILDNDLIEELTTAALEKNIKLYQNSKVIKIDKSENNKAIVTFEQDKQNKILISDKVLVAIGREANLENLRLENANIELDERKRNIKVNNKMQTNIPNIYAIGDVTGIMQLAHVASHQGITAVENILGHNREMDYSAVPNVIFTDPEIATVGVSEFELKNQNIKYKVSKFNYSGNGKALTMEKTKGFVKLIKKVDDNVIIGGSIIGIDASTLINVITVAIKHKLTEQQMIETIFPHPTTGEVIHEAFLGLGIGPIHYHE